MIQLTDVKKTYPGFTLHIPHLRLENGRITGLVGTNGSGKTTTFKLLTGLTAPDQGSLTLFDKDIHAMTVADKQKIGVVFNDAGFRDTFTPAQISRILASFYPAFHKEKYERLLADLEVPVNRKIAELSTGMQVRFKIAAALSHDPQLLILDEPTAGLDVVARRQIYELLQTYMEKDDHSILISSHIASDLESLCDDFYIIHQGRPVLHETVEHLLDDYGILHLDKAQYEKLDKAAVIACQFDQDRVDAVVSDRAFYEENYPGIVTDSGSLDDLLVIMVKGEIL